MMSSVHIRDLSRTTFARPRTTSARRQRIVLTGEVPNPDDSAWKEMKPGRFTSFDLY